MTLDHDTLAALGYGDAWEQLALRWPLYVVARAEAPQDRAWRLRDRAEADARYRAAKKARAEQERLERRREQYRRSKQKARAQRAARAA